MTPRNLGTYRYTADTREKTDGKNTRDAEQAEKQAPDVRERETTRSRQTITEQRVKEMKHSSRIVTDDRTAPLSGYRAKMCAADKRDCERVG